MRSAAESVVYHLSGWYQFLRGKSPAGLMTDPVCHMRVNPDRAAATRTHDDSDFFFCSTRCAERFEADPERYLTASSS
jgi:Cu+-exporting ATPase